MKKTVQTAAACGAVLSLILTGCGKGSEGTAKPEQGKPSVSMYSQVLDDPGKYSFDKGPQLQLTGKYEYALVNVNGDDRPELLVAALGQNQTKAIRVFGLNDSGDIVAPEQVLIDGEFAGSGDRGAVFAAKSNDRIIQRISKAHAAKFIVNGLVLDGDHLRQVSNSVETTAQPSAGLQSIRYTPVEDRAALAAGKPTVDISAAQAPPQPVAPAKKHGEARKKFGGLNVVTGTVRVMSAPEVAKIQGLKQTPNGEPASDKHAILLPNRPQKFKAQSSGDFGMMQVRTVKLIGLGQKTKYMNSSLGFDLNGQHVTLKFNPKKCMFPSDSGIPLAEPSCEEYTRLD